MITEEEFDVDLVRPTIICDKELDNGRKQLHYPLPNKTHRMTILAPPGGGKTSFFYALIGNKKKLYNGLFDRVHLVMGENSRQSVKGGFRKHQRVYNNLDEPTFTKIMEQVDETVSKGKCHASLVIYDDVASNLKADKQLAKLLKESVWNSRHFSLSSWFILQSYLSMPRDIRKVTTHLAMWNFANAIETETVYQELLTFLSKDEWEKVKRYVFDVEKFGKHTFIFADIEQQEIFRVTDKKFFKLKIK